MSNSVPNVALPTGPCRLDSLDHWLDERINQQPEHEPHLQQLYVYYHENVSEVGEFYRDLRIRQDPHGRSKPAYTEAVIFILAAAAAGVIGNAAWTSLLALMRKIRAQEKDADLDEFESYVSVEHYEVMRLRRWAGSPGGEKVSEQTERTIKMKYERIVR